MSERRTRRTRWPLAALLLLALTPSWAQTAGQLPLLVGSALGGWLGAALALGPNARLWIYRLLIGTLGFETVDMQWHWLRALL